MKQFLVQILKARVSGEGWTWFEKALGTTAPEQKTQLLAHYTGASKRLGKNAVFLDEGEKTRLQSLNSSLSLDNWGLDEIGRAAVLLSLSHLPSTDYAQLVLECYELGDSREQQSWLRALSLLPGCERFLETAVDACRTNILPVFEAIACENPYPALYFSDLHFNQMVLKSLFTGITVWRIAGLESRFNSELSRMADDYASERESAGRSVPPDIWLVLAPRISTHGLTRVYRYLHQGSPEHRYWAAVGLGHSRDPNISAALEKQRSAETEQNIIDAIDASLAKMVE